jgi:hypothetical protein
MFDQTISDVGTDTDIKTVPAARPQDINKIGRHLALMFNKKGRPEMVAR